MPGQEYTSEEFGDQQADDNQSDTETAPKLDELTFLKQRAKLMGITHSGNIGVETLRQKIADKLAGTNTPEPAAEDTDTESAVRAAGEDEQLNPLAGDEAGKKPAKKKSFRQQLIDEETRLIRCRITCMDPKKKDLPGEIFTVANKYIGTIKKFVPFGEVTDEGYHIPKIIYTMMEERRFLNIRTIKDRRNGNKIRVETNWAKEFAIEVLPPLTAAELQQLAAAQAAAGSTQSN